MSQPASNGSSTKPDWVELVATVLLALAAVGTAWSGYQANRWTGEQAKATSRTNALRIEAAREQGLAQDETQVDIATFIQWVDAYASDETTLQSFYETRFRPEFKPAFEAWIATDPFEDASAPPTPFAMPQYRVEAKTATKRLDAATARSAQTVQDNIQRSSNYVLAVVLFAVVLFFAGISTKLRSRRSRIALLAAGCVLFAADVVWIATFPVTMSV